MFLSCFLMLVLVSMVECYLSQSSFGRVNLVRNWNNIVDQRVFPAAESSTCDLPSRTTYLVTGVALPALFAYSIPELLTRVTDFSISASERQTAILLLLLTKRVALYSAAISIFHLASTRAMNVSTELGKRIAALNEDILGVFGTDYTASLRRETSVAMAVLDETDEGTQAALLPALVAVSLFTSFLPIYAVQKLAAHPAAPAQVAENPLLVAIGQTLQSSFPSIAALSAGLVCVLFARVEILAVLRSFGIGSAGASDTDAIEKGEVESQWPSMVSTAAAVALTATSFLSPPGGWGWVLQNTINAIIAIVVTRAVQLPRLVWVLVALVGLMIYDVAAVGSTQALTDGGASIMEAVARAKAGLPVPQDIGAAAASAASVTSVASIASENARVAQWTPGLLQVATLP